MLKRTKRISGSIALAIVMTSLMGCTEKSIEETAKKPSATITTATVSSVQEESDNYMNLSFKYFEGRETDVNLEKSLEYINKAIEINPSKVDYTLQKGIILSQMKNFKESNITLEIYIEKDKSGGFPMLAYESLVYNYNELGQQDKSTFYQEKIEEFKESI